MYFISWECDLVMNHDTFRKCRACGFRGYMDSWLANYIYPKCVALALLVAGLIPRLIFLVLNRKKLKCPTCGELRN